METLATNCDPLLFLEEWKRDQESCLEVALNFPYRSLLSECTYYSKNKTLLDTLMSVVVVGLQVECLPDQSIFWLIGDLSLCVPLFKFKDAGVLHQMLQHFQRLNVPLENCSRMLTVFLRIADVHDFNPWIFRDKYWIDHGGPFVVAFKTTLEYYYNKLCGNIQFRVFYINRNLSQEVAALYKMATELTCLFDAFVGGCTWLEEFRGRLLVVACAMVKACHGQVSMWRELHLFLEPLLALSWLQFPIKTVRELDSINAFIQVCQEAVLTRLSNLQSFVLPEVLEVLGMLFLKNAGKESFFMRYGACAIGTPEAEKVASEAFSVPPSGASWLFIQNANMFYAAGGFDFILDRLETDGTALSISEVSTYAHVFSTCRWCCSLLWIHKYIQRFFCAVRERLRNPSPLDFLGSRQNFYVLEIVQTMSRFKVDCPKTYSLRITMESSSDDDRQATHLSFLDAFMLQSVETPTWMKNLPTFEEGEIRQEIKDFKEKHDRWMSRRTWVASCLTL